MPEQLSYGHFGRYTLGDCGGHGVVVFHSAPRKYYDDAIDTEDKTHKEKADVLFLDVKGDWIFIDFFPPQKEEYEITEEMYQQVESYLAQ